MIDMKLLNKTNLSTNTIESAIELKNEKGCSLK